MSRVLPILFNTDMVRAILDGRKTVTRRVIKPQPPNDVQCPLGYCVDGDKKDIGKFAFGSHESGGKMVFCKPPCEVADILYVRESVFQGAGHYLDISGETVSVLTHDFEYYADGLHEKDHWKDKYERTWMHRRPSIHMPKEAARIFLKVKDIRVEQLQDITEEQAKAEGICRLYDNMSKEEYEIWAKKIGKLEAQEECSFMNYLWHGNFGSCGCGNKLSDAWEYQYSGYDNAVGSFSSLWNTTVDLKDWEKYGWDANPYVWVIEFERCEKPEEW